MTQEQKRIKIAEACGWKRHYNTDRQWRYDGDGPDDWIVEDELPDYFNDLNAMHEAERVLTQTQQERFVCVLDRQLHGDRASDLSECFGSLHATAAQRAEAFGRTLGLWT